MPNLSALSNITTTATALSNLILVNPQDNVGITAQLNSDVQAFLFDFEGEQTITLDSEITDHYVEDNTAIQDQIANKPEMITTHGFIGELNDIAPKILQPLKLLADKLTIIDAYTPELSISAIVAYNTAVQLYAVAQNAKNSAVSAWNALSGNVAVQNKQQLAFQQFYGYWQNRTLFTVQTPWAVFRNMAIKNLRAVQDAETRVVTDFEVTFKQMRFAQTTTNGTFNFGQKNGQGREVNQSDDAVNLGANALPPVAQSQSAFLNSSFPGAFL